MRCGQELFCSDTNMTPEAAGISDMFLMMALGQQGTDIVSIHWRLILKKAFALHSKKESQDFYSFDQKIIHGNDQGK